MLVAIVIKGICAALSDAATAAAMSESRLSFEKFTEVSSSFVDCVNAVSPSSIYVTGALSLALGRDFVDLLLMPWCTSSTHR